MRVFNFMLCFNNKGLLRTHSGTIAANNRKDAKRQALRQARNRGIKGTLIKECILST